MEGKRALARLCLAAVLVIMSLTLILTKGHPRSAAFCRAECTVPEGTHVMMTAKVSGKLQSRDGQVLILTAGQLIHKDRLYGRFKCYLFDQHDYEVSTGDTVRVGGVVSYYEQARNPGGFDRHFYYGVRGINGRIRETEFTVIKHRRFSVKECLFRFGTSADDKMREALGEEYGGLLSSMLLGRRMLLDEEVRAMYQKNGIAHLIAISGLHLSLLGESIRRLLRKVGAGKSLSAGVVAVMLFLYIGIAGAQIALVRAFIMYVIRTGASLCGRAYDSFTALALSAAVILAASPYYLWDASFQLSYGALAGVCCALTYQKLGSRRPSHLRTERAMSRVGESFVLSAAVFLSTFPLICLNYYEFAPYSLILNLIVIPLLTLILIGGAAGTAAGFLPVIGSLASKPGYYLSAGGLYINKTLCRAASCLPFHRIVTGKPPLWIVLMYYAFLLASFVLLIRQKRDDRVSSLSRAAVRASGVTERRVLKALSVLTAAALAGLVVSRPLFERADSDTRITMLDIGQGDCLCIADGSGNHFLVDGGSSSIESIGRYVIEPFLLSKGIARIDAAFVSHGDYDHTSGISEILERQRQNEGLTIRRVITTSEDYRDDNLTDLLETAGKCGALTGALEDGDIFNSGRCAFTCLGPPGNESVVSGHVPEAGNAVSMILELRRGRFKMLFTGDTEGEGESALTERLKSRGPVTILKTAHHGSANSTGAGFLQEARPRLALISAGKDNLYGHPSPETLGRLRESGCRALCTKECGAVTVRTDGKNVSVVTYC